MTIDVDDIEKHMPGFLAATVEWFRIYKIPDGKPPNMFAFNAEARNRDYALEVIEETHEQWKKMVAGQVDAHGINRWNGISSSFCFNWAEKPNSRIFFFLGGGI